MCSSKGRRVNTQILGVKGITCMNMYDTSVFTILPLHTFQLVQMFFCCLSPMVPGGPPLEIIPKVLQIIHKSFTNSTGFQRVEISYKPICLSLLIKTMWKLTLLLPSLKEHWLKPNNNSSYFSMKIRYNWTEAQAQGWSIFLLLFYQNDTYLSTQK